MENKERYFRLVKEQAELFERRYQSYCDDCREHMDQGCKCDDLAAYAYLEYALYRSTGEKVHGAKAAKALTDMGRLSDYWRDREKNSAREEGSVYTVREAVLKSGRPQDAPMEAMFCPTYYLLAYRGLEKDGFLDREEKAYCQKAVFRSIVPLFCYTDWGPHNRGMIKGTNLMLAGICFPEAKQAGECIMLGEVLCGESLGKWSIEDAQVYLPIWLNQIIVYQEVCGGPDYYDQAIVRFYFEYMMELMTPEGMMPEFGDGRFLNSAEAYICCLEKGASVYQNGRMKYAASRVTDFMCSHLDPYESTMNNICFLASALLWSDETLEPECFRITSREIPEDMIGKKYRFCNGEDRECQYLLFNYRDEGDYGRRVRSYMRSTLVVEQEKMHHGHSDENSITLLCAGNSILLQEGGYREMDGAACVAGSYRSDFFHNRLLLRNGILPGEAGFLEYCKSEPDYCPVSTDKIYFEVFQHCDTARTRLLDRMHGAQCERCMVYDKENGYYLVVDIVTALRSGDYTFGPMFYGEVLERAEDGGQSFYLTNLESVCDQPLEKHFPNCQDYRLKVMFPQTETQKGSEQIRRGYHRENGLYQVVSRHMEQGETKALVTLLQPVKQDGTTKEVAVSRLIQGKDGIGVEVSVRQSRQLFAFRYGLDRGHIRSIVKPDYDFSRTGVQYGALYTDAQFAHIAVGEGKADYELLSFTRAEYADRLLWQVPASSLIQGNWSLADGVAEWNKWYGQVPMPPVGEGENE